MSSPEEQKASNPIQRAANAPLKSQVAPFGKPPKEKRQRAQSSSSDKPRDKRWFLRIVAWVILAMGTVIFLLGVLPSESAGDPDALMTDKQMMTMAALPFMAFGLFLVWWGYSRVGEPMVACPNCFHINKPRSTVCIKCSEKLG